MSADTRGIREGFHEETRKVSTLTARVAKTKDGWNRGSNLSAPGVTAVSEIYEELSAVIAMFGALAQQDTREFDQFGVNIEVQDAEDSQVCEVPQ